MDLASREGPHGIEFDILKTQDGLNRLRQDCETWSREREERDLVQLSDCVVHLEADVSLMQSDCMCAGFRFKTRGSREMVETFHHAFSLLDSFFSDLKKVRRSLYESYIHPADLRELEIDWGRFRKAISQVNHYFNGEKTELGRP